MRRDTARRFRQWRWARQRLLALAVSLAVAAGMATVRAAAAPSAPADDPLCGLVESASAANHSSTAWSSRRSAQWAMPSPNAMSSGHRATNPAPITTFGRSTPTDGPAGSRSNPPPAVTDDSNGRARSLKALRGRERYELWRVYRDSERTPTAKCFPNPASLLGTRQIVLELASLRANIEGLN